MPNLALESIRATFLALAMLCLVYVGWRRADFRHRGWVLLLTGIGFLAFGSIADIANQSGLLKPLGTLWGRSLGSILAELVGYTCGTGLVTLGFLYWAPVMSSLERINELVAELQEANSRLCESNHRLREQMTARREAEQETRKDRRLLRAILESSRDAVLVVGEGDRILHANQRFQELWKIPSRIMHQSDDTEVRKFILRQVCNPEEDKEDIENLYASEEAADRTVYLLDGRVLAIHSRPLDVREGPKGRVWVLSDITERHRTERELKEYAAALEEANDSLRDYSNAAEAATKTKSEFLANMSHEIRTPMAAILGYADILLNDADKQTHQQRVDALKTIQRNGLYLLELMNDILDLSKIEAGRVELERDQCSPMQVVSDVISLMEVRAAAKNLLLQVEYDGPVPETIESDPLRLRQVLINLVGNAIKFTELGSVRLKVRMLFREGSSPRLAFEVIDTGIGLTSEQAERLFQPFMQADNSTSRRFGGTGLGLTISKRLAGMLGGDISLSSEHGRGSTFCLTIDPGPLDGVPMIDARTLRCEVNCADAEEDAAQTPLECKILLAEDGPDNQRLIAFLLRKEGAEVDLVENGQEAYQKAIQAQESGCPYDVILMDMQMPVMDGYEATRMLRKSGYLRPVVALTAHAMAGDREKCLDAGCDEFATKPIDRKVLLATVRSVLEPTTVC